MREEDRDENIVDTMLILARDEISKRPSRQAASWNPPFPAHRSGSLGAYSHQGLYIIPIVLLIVWRMSFRRCLYVHFTLANRC